MPSVLPSLRRVELSPVGWRQTQSTMYLVPATLDCAGHVPARGDAALDASHGSAQACFCRSSPSLLPPHSPVLCIPRFSIYHSVLLPCPQRPRQSTPLHLLFRTAGCLWFYFTLPSVARPAHRARLDRPSRSVTIRVFQHDLFDRSRSATFNHRVACLNSSPHRSNIRSGRLVFSLTPSPSLRLWITLRFRHPTVATACRTARRLS